MYIELRTPAAPKHIQGAPFFITLYYSDFYYANSYKYLFSFNSRLAIKNSLSPIIRKQFLLHVTSKIVIQSINNYF